MSDESNSAYQRGMANRRAVLGDAWVDKAQAQTNSFNAEFQQLITEGVWDSIWSRPGLDRTTRRLLVLNTCIALGRWEEFDLHFAAALQAGISQEQLKEVLLQSAAYAGVPAANTAFSHALAILREHGQAPAPYLHSVQQGTGPVLVLSHALGTDLHLWDALAARLQSQFTVLRFDTRGHGRSAVPHGPYSMADLVQDAAQLIERLTTGPVHWVGISMGGMIGQGLAIAYPQLIKSLVVANSTSHYPEAAQAAWAARIAAVTTGGTASIADMVMERYFHAGFRAAQPAAVARARAALLATSAVGYAACCHAIAAVDYRSLLLSVSCPTLVLAGELDIGAPPSMSAAIASAVPHAQLQVLSDASHISVLEQPEAFYAQVARHLASVQA